MRKSVFFAALFVLPLVAVDLPQLKEGLWSVTTQTEIKPAGNKIEGSSTLCRDHAYDEKVRAHAHTAMKGCTITKETFANGKYTVTSHCDRPNMAIDTESVTTMESDSASHSEIHSKITPPPPGHEETLITIDEKFIGACPANMKPGDRTSKDGSVIHIDKSPTN